MTAEHTIPNYEDTAPYEYDAPRNGTTPLRRRNEHRDDEAERCLISAALCQPGVSAAVAATGITAEHFTNPTHAAAWAAIAGLEAEGAQPDAILVRDRANAEHQQVADHELVELQAHPLAYRSNAAKYAQIIVAHALARRARSILEQASEAVRLGADPHATLAALAGALPTPVAAVEPLVADMQAVLDGEADVILPNLAPRDDHATCLLYAPGINWLDGEPGKGKSMLAMWWAYRELAAGKRVVYIHFEGEGNKHNVGARLKQMGLTDASGLSYVKQSGSWSAAELAELRGLFALQPSLVVIDSVAGAMQAEGLDPEKNNDVDKWKACIPAWAVKEGAAALAVDHLTKNAENRGRFSIGAQRKLGIADVSYRLLMHEEAGLGRTGYGKLEVMKDREGALGVFQQGKVIANVAIASEARRGDSYDLRVVLNAPEVTSLATSGPTWYMERVSEELEDHGPMGKVQLRTRIGKRKDLVDLAIERLLDEGAIRVVDVKGNSKPFESVRRWFAPPPMPSVPSFYETETDDDGEPF